MGARSGAWRWLAVVAAVLAVIVLGGALAVRAHVNRLVSQDSGFEILGPGSQADLGSSARLEVPEGFVALVQESSASSGTVETIELCREPDYASPLLTVDRFEDAAALRRAVGLFIERDTLVETSAREPLPFSEGWRWYAKEGRTGSRLRALAVNERARLVASVFEGHGEADIAAAIRRFVRADGRPAGGTGAGQALEARPDRASLLGQALQDLALLGDAACSEGDARGCSDGSFFALIVSVDPGSNAVAVDPVEYYAGAGAAAAAARDGRRLDPDEGVYVRNRDAARLELPFAEDAVVVLWYPPETVPSFGRPSAAALGALTPEEFAAEYARDESRRASLASAGARLIVQDGRITTLIENPTP